ncbi:MAG: hypothetical protein ACK5Y2_11070, partial [Bdellovibrionales bacterium]
TTCNDASVTPGTTYYYIVTATNVGDNTSSNEVSAVPMAAFTIGLTPGNRQIQASFASAGATSYSVQYGTSAGSYSTTVPGPTSPATISSLVNGTTYYFMVTASNSAGSITASAEVSSAPNGPKPFNISTATEGNGQVALTWGTSTGATSYSVRYGTSTGNYPTTFATGVVGTSSTVTGLTNGTTHYFMVTAVNANGSQDATAEFARTPAQPTLGSISDQTAFTQGSNWSADVPFTLGGLAAFTCAGTVAATSSNTSFVANGALTLSGTYPNCNLNISVGANQTGTTTITLTATHGSATATRSFQFQSIIWSPSVLSPALWLDATVSSTLTIATGVSAWRDRGGNGRSFVQPTAANQPAYSATAFFGQPGITFDGVNDVMNLTGINSIIANQTHGVYWVFRRLGNGSGGDPYRPVIGVRHLNGTSDVGALHYIKNSNLLGASYPYYFNPGTFSYDLSVGTSYNNTTGYIMSFQANAPSAATSWQVHRNGTLEGATNGIATSNANIDGYQLGAQSNPRRFSNVVVAEVIILQNTDQNARDRIEGYLAHKWGLAGNLPVGHPYKNSPP